MVPGAHHRCRSFGRRDEETGRICRPGIYDPRGQISWQSLCRRQPQSYADRRKADWHRRRESGKGTQKRGAGAKTCCGMFCQRYDAYAAP